MKARQVLYFVALGAILLGGCRAKRQDVTVFVSGDTAGWITPCGCTSNQSGGLARRATLISQSQQASPTLVVDVGGAVIGESPYDLVKLRAILNGQMKMNLDAFNLGGPESQFSPDQIRELQTELDIPFVSANLRDNNDKPIAPALRLVDRGGKTIAVAGVIDPELAGESVKAIDPYRSIYEAIRDVDADHIIVLAYMDTAKLKELALKLPNVDAVLGGPTGQVLPPAMVGRVLVSSSTNKGKFILKMKLPNEGVVEAKIVEVTHDIKEAESQKQNLRDFYAELGRADFSPTQTQFVSTRLMSTNQPKIIGSKSCVECHQQDDSVWHDSGHAHAWHSLETTGAQVDPSCQRCHTTGYGLTGGFETIAKSMTMASVGCENCHGPSAKHAADPSIRTPFVASEQCITCHDHENSPEFEYESYWDEIIHGNDE